MLIKAVTFRRAIHYLATIFDADSHSYRKNYDLALFHEGTGDKGAALKYYRECVSLNPNQDLYQNIGMLYFEMHDYVSAAQFLEKTSRRDEAGLYLGLSYLKLNAPLKAEETLDLMGTVKSTHARMLADNIYEFKTGQGRGNRKSVSDGNSLDGENEELKRLYEVLELSEVSSKKEIKKAYLKMAKMWHPDRYHNDPSLLTRAEQKMKGINEAYYKLCNS
jgi:tetratricopeptide (TPR) repeat protein